MKKSDILVLTLVVVSTLFNRLPAQQAGVNIDSFLLEQIREFHIPALSYAIIDNGKVTHQGTYGKANLEYGIPNADTVSFQLASATKLITATAIMKLVQDRKLDLGQRVRHYLPQLPEEWNSMTVIDLLAHQSGITDLLGLQYHFKTVTAALDTAMAKPLDFEPGTRTVYAGGDYAVVMKLIETVSGMEFDVFLEETLFKPLGMDHTGFNNMEQDYIYRTVDLMPHAASVYQWDDAQKKQRIFSMMFPHWTYPSGGLYASIQDLTKWAIALDTQKLLSREYAEVMWTSARLRDGTDSDFGVGWIVAEHRGEKATGHSGGPALADIVRIPGRNITAIVLTNQVNLRPFLTMRILDYYLEQNSGKEKP